MMLSSPLCLIFKLISPLGYHGFFDKFHHENIIGDNCKGSFAIQVYTEQIGFVRYQKVN